LRTGIANALMHIGIRDPTLFDPWVRIVNSDMNQSPKPVLCNGGAYYVYDLCSPVPNVLDACIYITWASGRGWALKILSTVFWVTNGTRLSARCLSQCPKNSRIPGPNPLPLALIMDMHASKTLCTGLDKS
jgi:hypothetical protein